VRGAIIATASFTAAVHLYLVVTPRPIESPLRVLFFLAAASYLISLGAAFLPLPLAARPRRRLSWLGRAALLATCVGSLVAYFVIVGFAFSTLSLLDKVDEAVLAVLIVADAVPLSQSHPGSRT
jgi:predicted permease